MNDAVEVLGEWQYTAKGRRWKRPVRFTCGGCGQRRDGFEHAEGEDAVNLTSPTGIYSGQIHYIKNSRVCMTTGGDLVRGKVIGRWHPQHPMQRRAAKPLQILAPIDKERQLAGAGTTTPERRSIAVERIIEHERTTIHKGQNYLDAWSNP